MPDKLYAGVGARELPYQPGFVLADVALTLSRNGFKLRSGGAKNGADRVFEINHDGPMEIFTSKTDIPDEAFKIASEHCKNWETYSDHVKRLMARNVLIFLGKTLKSPVAFSVLWSPADLYDFGGSAQGMRICLAYDIPYFNLRGERSRQEFNEFLKTTYPGETLKFHRL